MSPVRSTSLSSSEKLNRAMMEEALRRGLVIEDFEIPKPRLWEMPTTVKGSPIRINENPNQVLFMSCLAEELLYGGAMGGGKTFIQCYYQVKRRYDFPGSVGSILRLKSTDLFQPDAVQDQLTALIGHIAEWNNREHRWTFPDGGIIHLGFMPKTKNEFINKWASVQLDDFCMDEATQWPQWAIAYLKLRVRATMDGITTQKRYGANPGNVSHNYFKSRFVDPAKRIFGINVPFTLPATQSEPNPPTRAFIPSLVTDNKVLMDRDPNYEKNLMNMPELERKMYRYGDWDVFAGQFFSEWDEGIHVWNVPFNFSQSGSEPDRLWNESEDEIVKRPSIIPADWNRVCGLDWGHNHPTVVYWGAVDPGYGEIDPDAAAGTVWLYREMWVRGKQVSDKDGLCERIKEHKDTPPVIASGDDVFTRQSTTLGGPTIAAEFAQNGVILSNPCAGKRRRHRWQQMRAYLQWRDDDMKPIPGRPRLRILAGTCPKLCEQMAVMTFSETDPEDMKKVNIDNETGEGGDDCVDALSVLLMSQPWASLRDEPGINPATISDKLTAHQILELKRQKARRRNKRTGGRPTRV